MRGRTPHIHFKIKKAEKELLTTQCYVKGERGNARDFIYQGIRDPRARSAVTIDFTPIKDSRIGELTELVNDRRKTLYAYPATQEGVPCQ